MSEKIEPNLTFENAMEGLEEITLRLESGKDSLETSMNLYERGMALKDFCEKKLKEAEGKWTVLKKQKDDSIEEMELPPKNEKGDEQNIQSDMF